MEYKYNKERNIKIRGWLLFFYIGYLAPIFLMGLLELINQKIFERPPSGITIESALLFIQFFILIGGAATFEGQGQSPPKIWAPSVVRHK